MTDHPIIIFMALLLIGYGAFSKLADKSMITAPMVFVTVGMIVGFLPLHIFEPEGPIAPSVKVLAELTLILVLFLDASGINKKALKQESNLPTRLLAIGLPLTMVLGTFFAIWIFPDEPLWKLVVMALILSPTDAALGVAVVTSKLVPQRIRQTINVESGLNDGIALPPILICFAILAGTEAVQGGTQYWLIFVVKQFLFGPIIGGLVGWLGGKLIDRTSEKEWMNHTFQQLAAISLSILAFAMAESVHGNGFIAAYFSGLFLAIRSKEIRHRIREFGEAGSQIMVLFIFLLFGLLLVPLSFPYWNVYTVLYALLSLTIIRMVPVVISLTGTDLSQHLKWFIAWFGPRGIASVLYLLMMVIQLGAKGYERIISVITLTVLLSIFLHGISAVPYSRWIGKLEGKKVD